MIEKIRYLPFRGAVYLRDEDVAEFIVDLGSREETDVRNRLNEAAAHLSQMSRKRIGKIPKTET